MRVLFIPTIFDGFPKTTASARIRCEWVCRYWPEAGLYDGTQRPRDYDAVVFQKVYLTTQAQIMAEQLRAAGKVLAFDLCDPVWLHGGSGRLLSILPHFDFGVCPTEPLRDWLGRWLPAYVIPDRLDLAEHRAIESYSGTHKPSCVWYGYSANWSGLEALLPTLAEHDLAFTVLTDKPYPRPGVGFVRWESSVQANAEIVKHDIALLPAGVEKRFAYKSNNRELTAMALGLPVARIADDVIRLLDPVARRDEGRKGRLIVEDRYDVRRSVEEWAALIEEYRS